MQGQRGFTYLLLLFWIAAGSALLAELATNWSLQARRHREEEFFFRGRAYQAALASYSAAINVNGCANVQELPLHLEDLLDDRRCGLVRHHLRQMYGDPVAGGAPWETVLEFDRVRGVRSRSNDPLIRSVDGARTYHDVAWLASPADPSSRGRPQISISVAAVSPQQGGPVGESPRKEGAGASGRALPTWPHEYY